jgi:hypothetical protein
MMRATPDSVDPGRDGVPSIWRPYPRPTVPPVPLHDLDDEVRVVRRRQYGRHFVCIAGAPDPYPPPAWNLARGTPFGLTVHELRVEYRRLRDREGWTPWELDARLRPSPVADLAGVAA